MLKVTAVHSKHSTVENRTFEPKWKTASWKLDLVPLMKLREHAPRPLRAEQWRPLPPRGRDRANHLGEHAPSSIEHHGARRAQVAGASRTCSADLGRAHSTVSARGRLLAGSTRDKSQEMSSKVERVGVDGWAQGACGYRKRHC